MNDFLTLLYREYFKAEAEAKDVLSNPIPESEKDIFQERFDGAGRKLKLIQELLTAYTKVITNN